MPKAARTKNTEAPCKRTGALWRFQMFSAVFIVALVVILLFAANIIMNGISRTISDDYAYFYSVEAVDKLNGYLNREISLVARTARSKALAEWFLDEQNTEKKTSAFEEMLPYGDILFSAELYFVIDESLNEYSVYIRDDITIDDFVPFDVIDPDIEYNQWYYRCIESPNEYTLNIDIDKVTNRRRLWINHKVVKNGEILGVFCSGLDFGDIISNLFATHDVQNVRSIIIDSSGIIQMDNTRMSEAVLLQEEEIHFTALNDSPALFAAVETKLREAGGYFTSEDVPLVIEPKGSEYRYVSVAPVANTDWMVISLYNSASLFSVSRLYPLIFAVLFALLLCLGYITLLSRKMIINPFKKLLDSLTHAWDEDSEKIYGYGLQNEFGEIFNTIQYTQLLFNATPLCCFLWNEDKKVINCNEEALKLFKLENKEEFNRRFAELSPEYQPSGEKTEQLRDIYLEKAFKDGYLRAEWTHKLLDGQLLPCEIICVRLRHTDKFVVAAYLRDLRKYKAYLAEIEKTNETLRQARDAAELASRSKSEFLATMSHEIRTPLNAILGITRTQMQRDDIPAECVSAFEKIDASGSSLLGIINNILDLSKIESGKLELNIAEYDVANLINDVVQINIVRIGSKPIEFILDINENLPSKLRGDELRIKQVLNNLLSNAVKYTEKGYVKLSVSSEASEEESGEAATLCFVVEDTGQGIKQEDMGRLFTQYLRFNIELNYSTEGTGLGLNITKRLLSVMNGDISAKSEYGKGSVFTVTIVQSIADASPIGADTARNIRDFTYVDKKTMERYRVTHSPMPHGSILIVDDIQINLFVAQEMLAPYELKIETAESGFEALEKVEKGGVYDIIFMDHMMPKMDGIETTRKLRENGYKGVIIALTANALAGNDEMFKENGFDDFLAKPIDISRLDAVLNRFVRR